MLKHLGKQRPWLPLIWPTLFAPMLANHSSMFLGAWSLCTLSFTIWRIIHETPRVPPISAEVERNAPQELNETAIVRRLAYATVAIQLLPFLWIAGLSALQAALAFAAANRLAQQNLLLIHASGLQNVLLILPVFAVASGLIWISRRAFHWHQCAAKPIAGVVARHFITTTEEVSR